jgi:hypothetical protein
MPPAKPQCANVKSRKFQHQRCPYAATKGDYCCRHWKKPKRFEGADLVLPVIQTRTRSITQSARKIQAWWRLRNGLRLARDRTPAFFVRELCHNTTELASMDPLETIPRDYFFVMKESGKLWGFDIRSLVVQYEAHGSLENSYTLTKCTKETYRAFQRRTEILRKQKLPLHFESVSGLTAEQSWNLRVLDICLRLDMLGYHISTQWFTDLSLSDQHRLYSTLYNLWNEDLGLTYQQQDKIVPDWSKATDRLFKWHPSRIWSKQSLDSVRRTNINVIERLISSAVAQPDKTLGAMYSVMALCYVSPLCRRAYPWMATTY